MSKHQNHIPQILVVDDSHKNLVAMKHILKKIDGDIVCVESGNEALKQLIQKEFAVILMDVQMPDMNGFETAEIIRNNSETHSIPIIFVTAINKEDRYVQQGYQLGAVDYLFKPFDPSILKYKVSVFVELYRQKNNFINLAIKNQLILDSVREGVLGINLCGKIIFSNPAAAQMLSSTREQLDNQDVNQFIIEYEKKNWKDSEIYKTCITQQNFGRSDLHFKAASEHVFPVDCKVSAMLGKDKNIEGFVLVFDDISSRLKAEQQLLQLAEYDPLTGLANRRLFYRMLPKILAQSQRQKTQVALFFIDIDHFKTINDSLGHVVGDLLLSSFAKRLKSCVRESDTVVRISGDEFTVILEGELTHKNLSALASNIIKRMVEPFTLNNNQVNCSVSIGIASSPDVTKDANELIKAADIAMYNAKEKGRNTFQFYDSKLNKLASFRAQIETGFSQAILNSEFHLAYQPKVNLSTGKAIGFEALLRWNSQQLGKISPSIFIPIAEDSGKINELGYWVLQHASQQLKEWSQAGLVQKDFSLSVNFSTKQLNNPNFLLTLEKTLKDYNIDPVHLDVEITETTLMSSPDAVIPLLRILSEMGMTISVDDFGTGYSSLNYLKVLPIDNLKIDQSFIRDIFRDTNSEIITRSIINLAHNLNLKVIAEGIETLEQKDFLDHYECDYGQGFYFEKALAPVQAQEFYKANI